MTDHTNNTNMNDNTTDDESQIEGLAHSLRDEHHEQRESESTDSEREEYPGYPAGVGPSDIDPSEPPQRGDSDGEGDDPHPRYPAGVSPEDV